MASWIHENGITGAGSWNFGGTVRQDSVQIFGSRGQIELSVFADAPIRLTTNGVVEELTIEHPKHVQQFHVEAIRNALLENRPHPSTGISGAHTAWVMDRILANRSKD